jgi:uncharacterized coiled-coil protein SlyX
MEREAAREDKQCPQRPWSQRTLVAGGTHDYRRRAVRVGISGRALQLVAAVGPRRFTADEAADVRDALEAARLNLDRVVRELKTVQEERDEAISLIRPPMEPNLEERDDIWAQLDDLEKRAAETDKRIEERKEAIARLIERLERLQRRLLRYC